MSDPTPLPTSADHKPPPGGLPTPLPATLIPQAPYDRGPAWAGIVEYESWLSHIG